LFDDEDKNKFSKIADSSTVVKDLVDSFAPSIFGN
jgi:DNA replicative helicase MCM subunit Mcm2 (Cdc46/Mcm family)